MNDRGMCKWLPYKSLNEQYPILERILFEKNKIPKPLISKEMADEINEVLTHYGGEKIKLIYWINGYLHTIFGKLSRIDGVNKSLSIEGESHSFKEIICLERT